MKLSLQFPLKYISLLEKTFPFFYFLQLILSLNFALLEIRTVAYSFFYKYHLFVTNIKHNRDHGMLEFYSSSSNYLLYSQRNSVLYRLTLSG